MIKVFVKNGTTTSETEAATFRYNEKKIVSRMFEKFMKLLFFLVDIVVCFPPSHYKNILCKSFCVLGGDN